jgi:S1-C subfamily serine protease
MIKANNGEEIVDFNGPMSILKSADSIEGLTITVVRKNEEKELEYEVQ